MGSRGREGARQLQLSPKYLGLAWPEDTIWDTEADTCRKAVGIPAGYYVQPGAPPQGGA